LNTQKVNRNQSVTTKRLKEFAAQYGAELETQYSFKNFRLKRGEKWVFVMDPDTLKPVHHVRAYNRTEWERVILHNLARMANEQE